MLVAAANHRFSFFRLWVRRRPSTVGHRRAGRAVDRSTKEGDHMVPVSPKGGHGKKKEERRKEKEKRKEKRKEKEKGKEQEKEKKKKKNNK